MQSRKFFITQKKSPTVRATMRDFFIAVLIQAESSVLVFVDQCHDARRATF